MRVAFDTSVVRFDRGGAARYVEELVPLLEALPGVDLVPIGMHLDWAWSNRLSHRARVLLHDFAWVPWGSARRARAAAADILHGAAFKVAAVKAPLTTVTVLDDTPWESPSTAGAYNGWSIRWSTRRSIRTLAAMLTLAELTADDVAQATGFPRELVHGVHLGVRRDVFRVVPTGNLEPPLTGASSTQPYVLLVAPFGPRKNAARMLEALERCAEMAGHQVVVVGLGDIPRTSLNVIRAGRVADDELARLYTGARFLLYASCKEGFGLPVLEAMSSGCPVVTGRGTATAEVTDDAALLIDPMDVASIASACGRLLIDQTERSRLSAAGLARAATFSWQRCAEQTFAAWAQVLGSTPSNE
ncbi:MAG: glycosyltransferase family 4 protein [Candidatus Dormibacteria bacterium]